MTRKRMKGQIKRSLAESNLTCDRCKEVVEVTIDGTLDYMLEFAQTVAQELVGVGLYTEAMVAGVIINKMKELKIHNC